jgi:hypothetical protein
VGLRLRKSCLTANRRAAYWVLMKAWQIAEDFDGPNDAIARLFHGDE